MKELIIMNEIPDIYFDGNGLNPCIVSPNAPYALFFEQTKDTLNVDADLFKRFAENCVAQFRHSKVYTNYKAYLFALGLDRCQILGNITNDMAKIEMHHNGITIFDITVIIITHLLNTQNQCTTFDVFHHLRKVHTENMVPLVMLCRSMHQLEHNEEDFYIPVQMTFGNWPKLIEEYHYGITYGIAKKLNYWIKKSLREQVVEGTLNQRLTTLNKSIREWSEYNECGFNNNRYNNVINPFNFSFGNLQCHSQSC